MLEGIGGMTEAQGDLLIAQGDQVAQQLEAVLVHLSDLTDQVAGLQEWMNDSLTALVGAAVLVVGYVAYRLARAAWGVG